jgi:hypothetical protein
VAESPNTDDPKGLPITRAMLPTHTIFQASTIGGGACRLPLEWTSCGSHDKNHSDIGKNSFCGNGKKSPRRFLSDDTGSTGSTVRNVHDFDEVVTEGDSYHLDMQTEASILRHVENENAQNNAATSELKSNISLYTERYYSPVMEDLQRRGLEILMMVKNENDVEESVSEEGWSSLFSLNEMKKEFVQSSATPTESSFSFSLPNNYSNRPYESTVKLPNFAVDYSDYALGAMIERVTDSFDLYATVFFLCHSILTPSNKKNGNDNKNDNEYESDGDNENDKIATHMSAEVYDAWKIAMSHFESSTYTSDGVRYTPAPFYCNISNTENGSFYLAEGVFVPNNISTDTSANQRLDILRCKMQNTEQAYMNLARTSHNMRIEILRGDFSLLQFRIPWGARATGFLLDPPTDQIISGFDPWVGFDKKNPGIWSPHKLHMCVSGWDTLPDKKSISLFLEWIQHHVLLGVDHIFTGVAFSWKSEHMQIIRKLSESFIDEELVTLTSLSGDGLDQSYRLV